QSVIEQPKSSAKNGAAILPRLCLKPNARSQTQRAGKCVFLNPRAQIECKIRRSKPMVLYVGCEITVLLFNRLGLAEVDTPNQQVVRVANHNRMIQYANLGSGKADLSSELEVVCAHAMQWVQEKIFHVLGAQRAPLLPAEVVAAIARGSEHHGLVAVGINLCLHLRR